MFGHCTHIIAMFCMQEQTSAFYNPGNRLWLDLCNDVNDQSRMLDTVVIGQVKIIPDSHR